MCICFDECFDELAETEFKAKFEQSSMLMKIYLLFTLQPHLVSCPIPRWRTSSQSPPRRQYQLPQKQTFGSSAWQLMLDRSCFMDLCHFFTFPQGLSD